LGPQLVEISVLNVYLKAQIQTAGCSRWLSSIKNVLGNPLDYAKWQHNQVNHLAFKPTTDLLPHLLHFFTPLSHSRLSQQAQQSLQLGRLTSGTLVLP